MRCLSLPPSKSADVLDFSKVIAIALLILWVAKVCAAATQGSL